MIDKFGKVKTNNGALYLYLNICLEELSKIGTNLVQVGRRCDRGRSLRSPTYEAPEYSA
jgi:hypothetical protein